MQAEIVLTMNVTRFTHEKTMSKFGFLPSATYNNGGEAYAHFVRYLHVDIDGKSRWRVSLTGGKYKHGQSMKTLKEYLTELTRKAK